MRKLLYIVTHPMTARHLMKGHPAFMREHGFDVYLIASPGEDLDATKERERISVIPIFMEREISPIRDLVALFRIYAALTRMKPDIVNAGTPKAALLGLVAAWLARVPLRIYTLRGLRLETKKGLSRLILSFTERVTSRCAHTIICVSKSLRQNYISLKLAPQTKIIVLGSGSSNGIDIKTFEPHQQPTERQQLRWKLNIPQDAHVIGFVGRLTKDKGLPELLSAFEQIKKIVPNTHLLILGDFEAGDPISAAWKKKIKEDEAVIHCGFVSDPAPFYAIMDVLAFPSYREGFPNAPLEAAACKVPTVGFRSTGTVDAVQDGRTGMLCSPGNVEEFTKAIIRYLQDEGLRRKHGITAYERARDEFKQERIWSELLQCYRHEGGTISVSERVAVE